MELRDVLRDLSNTITGIDFETIAITREDRGEGDGTRVYMEAYTADRSLVMKAFTNADIPDFEGRFGLSNLGMLQGLLNLKSYTNDSTKITVNNVGGENKSLIFQSDEAQTTFLVQTGRQIPAQPRFSSPDYAVTLVPNTDKVSELKSFTGVFKTLTTTVTPFTENGNLCFYVGEKNKNNHCGTISFGKAEGELNRGFSFPIERVIQTLNRVSSAKSKSMGISVTGMIKVTIDTGVAEYNLFVNGGI